MLTLQLVISTVLWLIGTSIATVLLAWELWQCILDGRYIDAMGWNGPMHAVLKRDKRVAMMRLSVASSYEVFGILILAAPGSLVLRVDVTVTLLWSAISLWLNALLDRRSRHYVAQAEGHEEYLPSALRAPRSKNERPKRT